MAARPAERRVRAGERRSRALARSSCRRRRSQISECASLRDPRRERAAELGGWGGCGVFPARHHRGSRGTEPDGLRLVGSAAPHAIADSEVRRAALMYEKGRLPRADRQREARARPRGPRSGSYRASPTRRAAAVRAIREAADLEGVLEPAIVAAAFRVADIAARSRRASSRLLATSDRALEADARGQPRSRGGRGTRRP